MPHHDEVDDWSSQNENLSGPRKILWRKNGRSTKSTHSQAQIPRPTHREIYAQTASTATNVKRGFPRTIRQTQLLRTIKPRTKTNITIACKHDDEGNNKGNKHKRIQHNHDKGNGKVHHVFSERPSPVPVPVSDTEAHNKNIDRISKIIEKRTSQRHETTGRAAPPSSILSLPPSICDDSS